MTKRMTLYIVGLFATCSTLAWTQTTDTNDPAKIVIIAHTKELTKAEKKLLELKSVKEIEAVVLSMKAKCWNENGMVLVANTEALGLDEAKGKLEALQIMVNALLGQQEILSIDDLPKDARNAVTKSLNQLVPSRIPLEGQNRKVVFLPTLSLRLKNGDKTVNVSYSPPISREDNKKLMQSPPDPSSIKTKPTTPAIVDTPPKSSLSFDWRQTSMSEATLLDGASKLAQKIADEKR